MKHESEMSYAELTSSMIKSANFRGHTMMPTFLDTANAYGLWVCVRCRKEAQVLGRPAPNQTYISGEAVALGCDDAGDTFAEWMKKVNTELIDQCGTGHQDLADQPWRDWHDDGLSPQEAAEEALENEGFYDFMED